MRTHSSLRDRLAPLALLPALAACAAALAAAPAGALGVGVESTPVVPAENWEARSLLRDTIFAPVGDAARRRPGLIGQQTGAPKVSFQPQTQEGSLYLVFANERGRAYPLTGAGTYVIKRSLGDGSFQQVKVFLQDDPGCYLRLFPDGDRTLMDVYLFDLPFQRQIELPVAFESLLTSPLSRIMDLSRAAVDWPLVLAPQQTEGDRRVADVAAAVRARLRGLRDMDDGAMDAAGKMVYIATGSAAGKGGFNCSGFAKWVIDGFYAPLAGHPMDITPLKARDAGIAKTWSARYEELYDPYFGLDWSRGLAKSIAQERTGTMPTDEEVDVRDDTRVPYVRDVGYPVTSLKAVLYFLAREEPGTLYVGSVNAPSALAVPDGIPTLRQHHHVIILLPYFDQQGAFQVTVMERNVETSIPSLVRRYGSEFVHLVHVATDGPFQPPVLPAN